MENCLVLPGLEAGVKSRGEGGKCGQRGREMGLNRRPGRRLQGLGPWCPSKNEKPLKALKQRRAGVVGRSRRV